jgi:hypothetical protein
VVAYDSRPNQFVLMQTFLQIRLLQCLVVLCLLSVIPARGGWTATGSVNVPRNSHTATLLQNGKVLVAGGWVDGNTTSSAEIYDPQTGVFSTTGSMNRGRNDFSATLLQNGNVLVCGGRLGGDWSAEIYNTANGQWSMTGSMIYQRYNHKTILLPNGKVLAFGGGSASAEVYDPTTGIWTATDSPTYGRDYSPKAALMSNGRVLIVGGGSGIPEVYNPLNGHWSTTSPMALMGYGGPSVTMLLANGKVFVAGGGYSNNGMGAEIYDPLAETWTSIGHEVIYQDKGAILGNGLAFLVEGSDLYDATKNSWSKSEAISDGRGGYTVTALQNGDAVIIGGAGYSYVNGQSQYQLFSNALVYGHLPIIDLCSPGVSVTQYKRARFMVSARGVGLTYRWQKDEVDITGATSDTLTIDHSEAGDAGNYKVVVSNANGSVTSLPATLTVIPDWDGDGLGDAEETGMYNTDPNLADSDTDGLTDFAEVRTHNTNPLSKDSDGDGFYDAYELQTGKSPLNAADKPSLVAEARTAIEFSFPSATGKTYRIEGSPNLDTWSTVEDGINGTGAGITRFYSTRDTPVRFFRVEESVNP